jgi:3-hydroxyisobutyrate dehydrogenase-like beta-hydroxyacid dehydrogenase
VFDKVTPLFGCMGKNIKHLGPAGAWVPAHACTRRHVGCARPRSPRFHTLTQPLTSVTRPRGCTGSGQHTKMVNQILIASNMIGVCEGLLYAHRCVVSMERGRVRDEKGATVAGSESTT